MKIKHLSTGTTCIEINNHIYVQSREEKQEFNTWWALVLALIEK